MNKFDKLELIRVDQDKYRTLGIFLVNEVFTCVTLEPCWQYNEVNDSCILKGEYGFAVYDSTKFSTKCLKLFDVPGRDFISIHYGNYPVDTNGCILVGSGIGENHVDNSRIALNKLVRSLKFGKGTITIK